MQHRVGPGFGHQVENIPQAGPFHPAPGRTNKMQTPAQLFHDPGTYKAARAGY